MADATIPNPEQPAQDWNDQQMAIQAQFRAQERAKTDAVRQANANIRAKALQGNGTFSGAAPAPKSSPKGGKRGK